MAHELAIDRSAWASRWRTRNTADKAFLSLGLLVTAVGAPVWPGGVVAGIVAALVALLWARIPAGTWARIIAAPTLFLLTGVVAVAISFGTTASVRALWTAGPFAITAPGLARAGLLAGRGLAGMAAVILLAATTPVADLCDGLRRLKVPAELVEIASLMYRLLFTFSATAGAIHDAQTARLGTTTLPRRFRSAGLMTSRVFVLAWDRARHLESGLMGRGRIGSLRTVSKPRPHSPRFLLASGALVIGTAVIGWWPW